MNRRNFLKGSSGVALLSMVPACHVINQHSTCIVSACSDKSGGHFAAAVNLDGTIISKIPLPARGHDVSVLPHKPGRALFFARRPDRFAMEVDFNDGRIVHSFSAQDDSHFYGHGQLSVDGQFLFTSENHFVDGEGMIVVRDTQSYEVVARYSSGGVGPHDIALMRDQRTLVIANGGIQTHPDWPRMKLNIDTMTPNLTYLDTHTGQIVEQVSPPHHWQSLRHLNVNDDDVVFIGVQYQGKKTELVPLVYSHQRGGDLHPFSAPPSQWRSMNQYTASLQAIGNQLSVSCPRGGQITLWDIEQHRYIASRGLTDVSGLTKKGNALIASTGLGVIELGSGVSATTNAKIDALRFDNHMALMSLV